MSLNLSNLPAIDVEKAEPLKKYKKDSKIVDYDYQFLSGCSFALRGPLELSPGRKTVVCLGSAATFGRFVSRPYAHILAESESWNVVNLGMGGARFETYLREPATLEMCKKADLTIVELMSARSYRSHIFEPKDHLGGNGAIAQSHAEKIREKDPDSELLNGDVFVNQALRWAARSLDWKELKRARRQVLRAYRDDAIKLIEIIGGPVLLLWFSQRSPDQRPARGSADSWNCGFPHFVDRKTINDILPHTLGLVEIVSSTGMPAPLTSVTTGKPVAKFRNASQPAFNSYYPSPEMHREAGEKLLERVREILI